jgi:hypothetical protein
MLPTDDEQIKGKQWREQNAITVPQAQKERSMLQKYLTYDQDEEMNN